MQDYFQLRASRTRPSHYPSIFSKPSPPTTAFFPKPPYPGLTQAQLRQIVLEQLG